MKQNQYSRRTNEIAREKLASILLFEVADPVLSLVTVTGVEVSTGVAEVRDTFKVPKVGIAAGCMVQEGELFSTDRVHLVRDGIVVYDGRMAALRRYKDDVKSVKAGFECGIGLENFQDIHPGDLLESYRIDQVARTE